MINIYIFFFIFVNICLTNSDAPKKIQSNNYYSGGWPINLDKKQLTENFDSANLNCPNGLGCECDENDDCLNNNCNKNQLRRKGNYCSLKQGDLFPQIKLYDQFEEEVDIYDFANKDDKYILIEMGTVWCGPCHSLASWLTWGENEIKNKPFWNEKYNIIKDLIDNGDIYFITILYEDEFRDDATLETSREWYSTYPKDLIPILSDSNKWLHSVIRPTGIPAISLIGPDMRIINLSDRGLNKSFDLILDIYNEKKQYD